jgi:hypothetical protein
MMLMPEKVSAVIFMTLLHLTVVCGVRPSGQPWSLDRRDSSKAQASRRNRCVKILTTATDPDQWVSAKPGLSPGQSSFAQTYNMKSSAKILVKPHATISLSLWEIAPSG